MSVANDSDVAHTIRFAVDHALPVSIRSGGHSYLGASAGPGVAIDLRALNDIAVGSGTAVIGAGAALIDVYTQLAARGVSVPAGSCPTVGISGLTLGGGIGVVARQYGLTCDRLEQATVVTAAGDVVSTVGHADLLWALKGGGGSFGVVTAMTMRTHATSSLAHAYLTWPWPAAEALLRVWPKWIATQAPDALWAACHLLANNDKSGPPTLALPAVYVGTAADLDQQLDSLVGQVGVAPMTRSVAEASYVETMLLEAGCASLSEAACHVAAETPGGTLSRDAFVAGSAYFAQSLDTRSIQALIKAVEARQADPTLGVGGASFDALGGAIAAVPATATAYVHRDAWFDVQYTASWQQTPGNGPLRRNLASLQSMKAALARDTNGEAYQNYPDATLRNPQRAYYGANLPRLIDIRRTYDPAGVFTQPQGVPLS